MGCNKLSQIINQINPDIFTINDYQVLNLQINTVLQQVGKVFLLVICQLTAKIYLIIFLMIYINLIIFLL